MNDPAYQFLFYFAAVGGVFTALGFFADHQRRKWHALAEAEREAEQKSAHSGA